MKRIERGKVTHLYVGLHGDPSNDANKAIIRRALRMPVARGSKRPLAISFYNSESANVWG